MNIAHIWKDDYPWDVRVEKISRALVSHGHQVHIICKNQRLEKTDEVIDGIRIHRLRPIRIGLINSLFSVVAFFNPVWIFKIYQVTRRENINVLLVRDLPLVISALLIGRICKKPVVFDMAENYPSMWRDHVDKRGRNFIKHFTKSPLIATLMENYVLKHVDHIMVVVDESKERLVGKGCCESKISIVSNTPEPQIFKDDCRTVIDSITGNPKVLYAGALNGGRGLDTVINAIPLIKDKLENFKLIIVGEGEEQRELKNLAAKLEVSNLVIFCGWIDPALVPSYIRSCDICIVPHDVTDFINSTIPNKLFDYMAMKKPVIASDAKPFRRILGEAKCGLIFKSRDSKDFAQKVIQLTDRNLREKMGIEGFNAVKTRYNWNIDSQVLLSVFEKLQARPVTIGMTPN